MEAARAPTDVMGLRLYEIAAELEAVVSELVENGGELTPELEAALDDWQEAFEGKAERTALVYRNLSGLAKVAKEEADRLNAIARARTNAAERLREYLHGQMERLGVEKVETERVRLRICKNSRPSIAWTRELEELPEAFRRVEVRPDTQAAYLEWRAGAELPEGFRVEEGRHLRIS